MSATETAKSSNTMTSKKSIADFFSRVNKKRKASFDDSVNSVKQPKLEKDSFNSEKDEVVIISDSDVDLINKGKENTDLNVTCSPIVQSTKNDDSCVILDSETGLKSSDVSTTDSSDELNSSNTSFITRITSSVSESIIEGINRIKNTIESVVQGEFEASDNLQTTVSVNVQSDDKKNNGEPQPKKRKKMSLEEAKLKSEEREQKLQERLLKKQETEAQKEQRRLERERNIKLKELEKLKKEEEKKEKERQRQEKKEQEELEKQQKIKEREEKEKMKKVLQELKLDDKKRKEELKLKKEEELKKAEEEKLKAKQEKERKEQEKKERNKAAFLKFFKKDTPSTPTPAPIQEPITEAYFKPFQISDDMTLAPIVSKFAQDRFDKPKLDQALQSTDALDKNHLYLQILKSGNYKDARLRQRQRRRRQCDAEVIVVDEKAVAELFMSAKLLQFADNVRPPYWGTWRKKSKHVRPRNPLGQDPVFDYDVDSDDEWDEGGPGESLSGTENEQESEDDYEVDNEFFVPHGYLSAEEEDEDEEAVNDPERQKALLKIKQQEFEKERKKKTTEIKPIILGCYFENAPGAQDSGLLALLESYRAEFISDAPIPTRFTIKAIKAEQSSPSSAKKNTMVTFPEEAMPHLIRLLHGNTSSKDTLVKEFIAFWAQQNHKPPQTKSEPETVQSEQSTPPPSTSISKRLLYKTIKAVSTYGRHASVKKLCWLVQDEIRQKHGLLDAPIPNEWVYVTKSESVEESSPVVVVKKEERKDASIKEFFSP